VTPPEPKRPAKKLVLAVIDAMKPEMLDRAIEHGRAPILAKLIERGTYVRDCVSTFPSVTPVAAATITTGVGPDRHHVPSMNWYHRGEERYVEYGSSFEASRTFGIVSSLRDLVYNLNLAHLNRSERTIFEHLGDAGIRSAGTTYMIYRGRKRHPTAGEGVPLRLANIAGQFRFPTWGPDELFYADLFASRPTNCRSNFGMPGLRDQHTGCVGAYLVGQGLFDFMLVSLPDNDSYSHRRGPYAQVTSIASADRALERIMHAGGGVDAFLEDHAVIVMSDHSQVAVEQRVNLAEALGSLEVLRPDGDPGSAQIAVSPAQRSGQVYVLDRSKRSRLIPRLVRDLGRVDGVDVIVRRSRSEAVVSTSRGELRFAPGSDVTDARGDGWSVTGSMEALDLVIEDGRVTSHQYPLALGRLWSAVNCPRAGDLLISAAPGAEFVDWGGLAHVGGGSHGALSRGDSLGALIISGVEAPPGGAPEQWTIGDVTPIVLHHFSLPS
jgi:Type I phosphodiesterase / nucleotide pyrophosphatase